MASREQAMVPLREDVTIALSCGSVRIRPTPAAEVRAAVEARRERWRAVLAETERQIAAERRR